VIKRLPPASQPALVSFINGQWKAIPNSVVLAYSPIERACQTLGDSSPHGENHKTQASNSVGSSSRLCMFFHAIAREH
jgi:hypothetical protein